MNTLSFLEKYQQLTTTKDFENKFKRNIKKVCKFCSKTSNETTFLNTPHVIPELFGKNNYTSNYECDECNKLFSYFETDIANFISPYQTLIGQKTKKKYQLLLIVV